jgi:D-amino-acid oxidase
MREATVLGAGVIGLTSAVVLLQRGCRVTILARELPWRTTSAVAAALWFPYEARPPRRVHAWARTTYRELVRLAETPAAGVALAAGVVHRRAATGPPFWRDLVPLWQPAAPAALPPGVLAADELVVPVAEMPVYLQYLVAEVQRLGGRLRQQEVRSLDEVDAPVVVQCTGLGARTLAPDPGVYAIRGVVVGTTRTVERFVLDDDHPGGLTYVVPRSRDCVLGGSAEMGCDDLAVRPGEADAIVARCAGLCPELATARVLEVKVGLRPGRAEVRLEAERLPGGRRLVHAYGHGGSGMTLSWGCAEEVAELVGV